jgi:hypothetical protein
MRTLIVVLLSLLTSPLLAAGPSRWTEARAKAWYSQQPWIVGANYLPSDAVNQLEMFQAATFNPALNDRELGLAESIGMNSMRVFLQDQLWTQDPAGFTHRLDAFLAIAAKHHIRVLLILFDSCWDPDPKLGPQHPPVPGVHNSGWVQSPGAQELTDPSYEPKLQAYVEGVVGAFATDPRVLGWDLWNEPDNGSGVYAAHEPKGKTALVLRLLPEVFAWARAQRPVQPLTSGVWDGSFTDLSHMTETAKLQLAESDVITFHNYGWPEEFESRIKALLPLNRPVICTEYMARGVGSTFDGDLPLAKKYNVGAMNWGLVAGKMQTYYPWDSWQRPYVEQEPMVWFHDVFRPNGTPYRQYEVDLIRQLTGRRINK